MHCGAYGKPEYETPRVLLELGHAICSRGLDTFVVVVFEIGYYIAPFVLRLAM